MPGPRGNQGSAAALFDAVAEVYDNVGVDFFGPIAAGLVAALEPQPGERWLDIGCGRGAALFAAAAGVGPTGEVVGTDIAPVMVELAREAAVERGLGQVQVLLDDAQSPVLGPGSFDALSSSLVLFFLADPVAALREWLPLLAPGGRLGVTTFGPMDPRWDHVDAVFGPYLPPAMRDARTSGRLGPFGSDAGMEELVRDAGFDAVRTVTADVPVRFADVEQWHAFTWSTGQRAMWMAIPAPERPAVRAEAEARLAGYAAPDGSIEFIQAVRHTLAVRP